MLRWSALVVFVLWVQAAQAVIETYEFSDPAMRERYRVLSNELRCPKCQNQNIADSNAPIAQDLRAQLNEQLQSGKSNEEIVDYMVQRYGEFVLYRPRFSPTTAVLWLSPVLLLALAGLTLWSTVRRSRRAAGNSGLQDVERERLAKLLQERES
ncbi:cytochrome c-type biogenesis protein CcmH [Halieaceae bacterium IMCC14734]|uniref:Cytochrome c-type biogenesis protein n=1 Tax=Candidatus Litorirhabdus singularis TaxID=2518993 RepID=A0ABT3TGS0_9GAMM|nr:cytochrome c-type biogenesis protein CcmH [Candidatus Litorirhabdus singularis]MCX2981502.1 cytochrome c-type biogenesis protein CcmH [Candidatus Litorirhabdus singularis]